MSNYGFVYILSNECMPSTYKIGFTTNPPLTRAQELSKSTSIPTAFDVVCYGECEDPRDLESFFHEEFYLQRISDEREFFKFTVDMLYENVIKRLKDSCIHFTEGQMYAEIKEDYENGKNKNN